MTPPTVGFYLPDRSALGRRAAEEIDPDRDWEVFGTGVYVWILQTFLRLRAAGAPVELLARAPSEGAVVAHADDVERLLGEAEVPSKLVVVATRSDRRPQLLADAEIVQNASSAGAHRFHVPSWGQPGLIPRDAARGTRVEVIAYLGTREQLDDRFTHAHWTSALRARKLEWDPRTVSFTSNDARYSQHRWNDYAALDVVVAVRPPAAAGSWSKPAAKLQNAWAAGVPAILSPDVPYRELRRSPLDYLEATDPDEALSGLDRLRADPALYQAMVDNGRERAREFEHDRILARWRHVLWHEVPALAHTRRHALLARNRRARAWVRGWRVRRPRLSRR